MKPKPKKKNPLSNPKSPESRIRSLELMLFELSCAAQSVIYSQDYLTIRRLHDEFDRAQKILPNKVTAP